MLPILMRKTIHHFQVCNHGSQGQAHTGHPQDVSCSFVLSLLGSSGSVSCLEEHTGPLWPQTPEATGSQGCLWPFLPGLGGSEPGLGA